MTFIEKTLKACHLPGFASSPLGTVGLSFLPQGIAVAVIDHPAGGKPLLRHCQLLESDAANRPERLQKLCRQLSLKKYACHLVLTSENYQLLNVEAPPVAENEMTDALRWKLNDLLDYPADQAIIDYFRLPPAKNSQHKQTLSIVASNGLSVDAFSQNCQNAGLKLKVIDIQEMVLRNLAMLLPENDRGIALLHLQQTDGSLVIVKDGEIYLSRLLDMGYQQLSDYDELALYQSTEEENRATIHFSNLALEIQRSLDYVESYYALPPIASIAIVPIPKNTGTLLDQLNSQLGSTARVMDITAIVECDLLLDDELQALCAPAIGAALRHYSGE